MPFSVLLLTAASSKRSIVGVGNSKVVMEEQPRPGEVVLFFQIDRDEVRSGLDMRREGMKCCDGLIFRSQDDDAQKVICLVELKSNSLGNPADQIIATRRHLEHLLGQECRLCSDYVRSIKWKACIYRHTSSPMQVTDAKKKLREAGFKENDIILMNRGHHKIESFLRGEGETSGGRNRG